MPDHFHHTPNLIYSVGTQVVLRRDIVDAADAIMGLPKDLDHHYSLKFADGLSHKPTRLFSYL